MGARGYSAITEQTIIKVDSRQYRTRHTKDDRWQPRSTLFACQYDRIAASIIEKGRTLSSIAKSPLRLFFYFERSRKNNSKIPRAVKRLQAGPGSGIIYITNESNLKVTTVHELDTQEGAWYRHSPSSNEMKVQDLNKILHSKVILYKEPILTAKEGQEAIRKLLEMRYLANHGDYMAEKCERLYIPRTYKSTQKLVITSIHQMDFLRA